MERGTADDCVLCPPLRFRLNAAADLPGAGSVLDSDEHFLLMPDLAPLRVGHLLLVSSRHHACAGAFGPDLWERARAWRGRVGRLYRRAYGSDGVLMFEHGPGRPQGGGACIDHAHWHLLPGRADLRATLEGRGLPGSPATYGAVRDRHRAGRSYLLVEEDGAATVHPGDGVPGQFLRWAVRSRLAPGTTWRWQESFGLPDDRERFLRTLRDLRVALPLSPREGPRLAS